MMVYAITDTKKGEQEFRLLIFKLPRFHAKKKCTKESRPSLDRKRHSFQQLV